MVIQNIADCSIFQGMDQDQLASLIPLLEACHILDKKVIFSQGGEADFLYILLQGEVVINFKPYDGPMLIVSRIQPGGVFGWSAALSRNVYTSGAEAVEECEVFRIRREQLHTLCEQDPDTGVILLERLASVIAERLHNTHEKIFDLLSEGMDLDQNNARKVSLNE
jgi:CRP/FNR family cyclic AMP-dependent transcriptional regulator